MVTVADILRQQALHLVDIHLPHPEAEVRWVATSELPDPTPFLEGGEVLLTTGLSTRGWRREWAPYVARLSAAGVVALGIGTGLTHRRPPVALVRACQDAALNLFDVPRETTFVAISRATAQLIEKAEQAAARRAVEMQHELTQAALRPDDGTSVLRRLAAVVSGGVCTVDRNGRLDLGPFGPAAAALDLAEIEAEVARIRPRGLRVASSLTGRSGSTIVQPLGLRGRPGAYLAAYLPGRPTEGERSAVTTAIALLGLAAESRNERTEADRRLRARVLELLLHGDARTARTVLSTTFGADASLPSRLRVLRCRGTSDALDDALAALERQDLGLSARVDGELRVVVPAGRSAAAAEVLAAAGLQVGVGGAAALDDAARSHATAGHALRETTAAAPVIGWDQLVGEGALALIDPDRAAAFARTFLQPLSEASDRDDLLVTLQSFLRHHGSRGGVAHELGVHRNTVRNRVEQIETALGRSLDDPQVRVNAWIALQAGTTADSA